MTYRAGKMKTSGLGILEWTTNRAKSTGQKQGAWVAQLVKHLTLGFGSHDHLMVHGIKPHVGLCVDYVDYLLEILSPSASPVLSLSQNK